MRCIVSLANDRGNYQKALDRLVSSVNEHNPGIPIFAHRSEDEVNAPKHLDNPYAFKVFAISEARNKGYTSILWLDSSCYLVDNITPLFEMFESEGYAMQEAGAFVGDWCNDNALNYFGVSREEAKEMLMYGNAGLLGLDFTKGIAIDFFSRWMSSMVNGCFVGEWKDHRHDMSCGSIIANQLGMEYNIKGDEILEYAAPEMARKNETIIIKAQGL